MCIFKHEQTDTGCGHTECKNYYMLNKQFCIHNPINPQTTTNYAIDLSNVLSNTLTPPLLPQNLNIHQSLNTKRLNKHSDKESDQAEAQYLNQKKIKLDEKKTSHKDQHTNYGSINNTPAKTGLNQQSLNQIFDNITLTPLLNNFMLPNNQINYMQPDAPQFNNMFPSSLQIPQGNDALKRSSSQPQKSSPQDSNIRSSSEIKPEQPYPTDISMKEFQIKALELLSSQNEMLFRLKDKNDHIKDALASLISEVSILKTAITQHIDLKTTASTNVIGTHQNISNTSEIASAETLINYLYGPKPDFKYHLVLKDEMELPLYRERNFKFTVLIVDHNGKLVTNANRIPLTIGIYSSENPPKYIDVNTAGNKILKGFIDKDLINGTALFDKIQVKEVTSHFRNGWIFFVVYPKVTKNPTSNVLKTGNGVNVDIKTIKPLIVEKVVVKAKKIKEKDLNVGGDETPSSQNDDF